VGVRSTQREANYFSKQLKLFTDRIFRDGLYHSDRSSGLENLHWLERRRYSLNCNWKVFVDNYLDGGYHVPHLHKGLDSVLDYSSYMIENGEHFCLQSSPMVSRITMMK